MAVEHPARERARQELATWVRSILGEHGISQGELARRAGVDASTISRMLHPEKSTSVPGLDTIQAIAQAMNADLSADLLDALGYSLGDGFPNELSDPIDILRDRIAPRTTVPLLVLGLYPWLTEIVKKAQKKQPRVKCPDELRYDGSAFAFHIPDSHLAPWIKAGKLAYATRSRDPVRDDIVVITRKDQRSMVCAVMDISSKGLELTDTLPPQVTETLQFEDIDDIAIIHSVEF
jgi:transcriptional regulator with XRE-family HTH domain